MHAAVPLREALRPLAGLRSLSSIAIMVFHHTRLRSHLGLTALYAAMEARPGVLKTILHSFIAMDVLFLLTAFFAGLALIPALTNSQLTIWQVVLQYWWRRAVRILPAFWVSLLVTYYFVLRGRQGADGILEAKSTLFHYPVNQCPGGLWYAAALLSQWRPRGGCGMQLWSQGVMCLSYFLFPFAIAAAGPRRPGFQRRLVLGAGAVVAASTAYRAWAVSHFGVRLPLKMLGVATAGEAASLDAYLEQLHFSSACRAGSMAIGILLALPFVLQSPIPTASDCAAAAADAAAHGEKNGRSAHSRDGPATANGPEATTGARAMFQQSGRPVTQRDAASENGNRSTPRAPRQSPMHDSPPLQRMLQHSRRMPWAVAALGSGLAAAVLRVVFSRHAFGSAGDATWPQRQAVPFLVFLGQGGAVSSLALAFLMLVAMTKAGPVGKLGHALLSARVWQPLADWSYSAYLYHEQVRYWLWRWGALPSGLTKDASDLRGLAIELSVTLAATFATAAVSYKLVEQPTARLLRWRQPARMASRRH